MKIMKCNIVTNITKDDGLKITKIVTSLLDKKNISYKISEVDFTNNSKISYTSPDDVDSDSDLVMVIGGDGTLLQTARDLATLDIPMLGINLGILGYLAEVETDKIEEAIDLIIENDFRTEPRIMLVGDIYRNGEKIYHDICLNDIVLGRAGNLRVIDFHIYVNNQFLNKYNADGVIIATPTGSTAYNLSAGGPILEPCANIIVVTPICSHTIGSRSIVLSADSEIKIEVCANRHLNDGFAKLYFDGNSSFVLNEGDIVEVTKSHLNTKIMKFNKMSFVEVLHKKMNK